MGSGSESSPVRRTLGGPLRDGLVFCARAREVGPDGVLLRLGSFAARTYVPVEAQEACSSGVVAAHFSLQFCGA